MKYVCFSPVSAQSNATTSFAAMDTSQWYALSLVVNFSDASAAGTLKLQASNDPPGGQTLAAGFVPTNWVDITNATVTVASGATSIIPYTLASYRWIRIVWTRSSGAGTLTVNMNAQEF